MAYQVNHCTGHSGLYKAVYFIPYMTSMVAISWIWRWLYQGAPIGVFNNVLIALGLPQQKFLMDPHQALGAILAPTIWSQLGFQMIIFLAGLKGISRQYYEAAEIDGAGSGHQLFFITIPLLRPTFIFLIVSGTIQYLRIFTQVLNMTYQGEGGPLNSTKPIVLYIYNTAFQKFEMGYAAAMTVILFLVILMVTLIQLRLMKNNG